MRLRTMLIAAVLSSVAAVSPAFSQPSQSEIEASKKAAIQSANGAFEAFTKGKYEDALAGFQKADQTFHTPKFLLFVARAQAKLGRLLSAKRSYERVAAEALPAYAQPEFIAAQADARKELAELLPRIPALRVEASAGVDSLKIDGNAVAAGQKVPVDPGEHTISGSSKDGPDVLRKVTLREGESRTETLEPPARRPSAEASAEPDANAAPADSAPRRVPTLTYVAYGVGAVGLVAGGVFGGLTLATKSDYDAARKSEPVDAKRANADVRQGRAFSIAADVGFAVAIAGAAAGTILWVVSPRPPAGANAGRRVFINPGFGGAAVGGSF